MVSPSTATDRPNWSVWAPSDAVSLAVSVPALLAPPVSGSGEYVGRTGADLSAADRVPVSGRANDYCAATHGYGTTEIVVGVPVGRPELHGFSRRGPGGAPQT